MHAWRFLVAHGQRGRPVPKWPRTRTASFWTWSRRAIPLVMSHAWAMNHELSSMHQAFWHYGIRGIRLDGHVTTQIQSRQWKPDLLISALTRFLNVVRIKAFIMLLLDFCDPIHSLSWFHITKNTLDPKAVPNGSHNAPKMIPKWCQHEIPIIR